MPQPHKIISTDTIVADERGVHDLFGAHYAAPLTPYSGVDFSRKCFVFPGQSAAHPGMGKADMQRFDMLQKRFAAADARARAQGMPVPSLYINAPDQIPAAQLPLVQCLALYTMSVGLFEVLLLAGERPSLLASHSFGEYAALVASGIASFDDVFDIVCERDRVCRTAGQPGAMIAISANVDQVRRILKVDVATIANTNSLQQTVVSVPAGTVKPVLESLRRANIPAKHLVSIPHPYHSSMLADAAQQLHDYVMSRRFAFNPPRIPILSSVSGHIIDDKNFSPAAIADVLAKQLTQPVDFIHLVMLASTHGCSHFIELAQLKTCTAWIKDILSDTPHKVSIPRVLEALPATDERKKPARAYDKKLVGFLNKIVSSVTGYSISEISLANNFQEDLGIDSIKKAQIVLNFLESQGDIAANIQDGVLMNQIRTIEDVLAWYTSGKDVATTRAKGRGLFSLNQPVWVPRQVTAIERMLEVPVNDVAWLGLGDIDQLPSLLTAERPLDGVVLYDDGRAPAIEGILSVLRDNYDVLKRLPPEFCLALVTTDASAPIVLALEGFIKSVALELSISARCFRFDDLNQLRDAALIEDELGLPLLYSVRFAGGTRHILGMQQVTASPTGSASMPKTVAAIGGSRGITRELVKTLMDHGATYICAMGRRPAADVQADLQQLQRNGVTIDYVAGDCADRNDMQRFIDTALAYNGTIDLVIHGGGVELSALVPHQSAAAVVAQVDVKVAGTQHLVDICRSAPIKRVVCFTSVAGEFGSLGQSVYSYANIAQSNICELANRAEGLSEPRFQCIAWPAWNQVGMAQSEGIYRQLVLAGYRFLDASEGCRLFIEALKMANQPRLVCIDPGSQVDTAVPETAARSLSQIFPDAHIVRMPMHLSHWTLGYLPDLRAHIVLDQPVVPIALSLATMFYTGFFKTGQLCKLEDVRALSFMLLHQKDSPYFIDCRPHDDGGWQTDIRSNEVHIEGRLLPCTPDDFVAPVYQLPELGERFDFGPDFQYELQDFRIIDSGHIGADGRAYVDLDFTRQTMRIGSDPINFLTLLIEAMLQMGGTIARRLVYKDSAPCFMKSIAINAEVKRTPIYHIVVESQKISDDLVTNTLYAYNANHQLFIAIRGEQVRMWSPKS
jgi:malonyl CoA-acyl carrier protein transacylase